MLLRLMAVLLALFVLPGIGHAEQARTITVTGEGQASAAPDEAHFSVAATVEALTPAQAMTGVSHQSRQILATLAKAGIPAVDIQTGRVTVQPVYARGQREPGRAPRVVAYRASQSQSVRVKDIARLGDVLDAVVVAGGDGLSGLSFSLSDRRALSDQARKSAMADAARAAKVLAAAAGVPVGSVVSIEEGASAGGPGPMRMMNAESLNTVPVRAGEITVSVRVRVVYQIGK